VGKKRRGETKYSILNECRIYKVKIKILWLIFILTLKIRQ
jgi:hypothetical protein